MNASPAPGSFSTELRSQTMQSRAGSRGEIYGQDPLDEDEDNAFERALNNAKDALNREIKIKEGSENLLEALNAKKAKVAKEQRTRVEAEISASNARIRQPSSGLQTCRGRKQHQARQSKAGTTYSRQLARRDLLGAHRIVTMIPKTTSLQNLRLLWLQRSYKRSRRKA